MRLTRKYDAVPKFKIPEGYGPNIDYNYNNVFPIRVISDEEIIAKLGQLEDIEEELGIGLITLFKALKNGVYYKYKYGYEYRISKCRKCYLSDKKTLVVDYHTYKYLCDYGKTWALTREELERR